MLDLTSELGDISDNIFPRTTHNNAHRIFFITEQYFGNLKKSCNRDKRAKVESIWITAQRRNQEGPKQFKRLLAIGDININFAKFLLKDWSQGVNHIVNISEKGVCLTVEKHACRIEAKMAVGVALKFKD